MARTTLKEVAQEAGVSVMTASLVLRRQGRISEATRARVLEIARRLDYHPDPALSALVHYRSRGRPKQFRSTLAFLTGLETEGAWRGREYLVEYHRGAQDRAEQLGYGLDVIWMRASGMSGPRLSRILDNRGIRGVMVAPMETEHVRIELDWERFCTVSLCRNLIQPKINTVDHNHRQSMEEAFEQLWARGYRRPGFVGLQQAEAMNGWMFTATLAGLRKRYRLRSAVPDLMVDRWDFAVLQGWVERYRPDVVLSQSGYPYLWMGQAGIRVPEEMGFIHFEAHEGGVTTGISQEFRNVGVVAVDLLHLELMRDERGVPQIRQSVAIDGFWVEGQTLRPP